jgi:Zn-dependent protease
MLSSTASPLFRFRVAGIPVRVQLMFVVVIALLAYPFGDPAEDAIWLVVAAGSVLWHELGHALTMRRFGYPPWVELHAMGGLAHWPEDADPTAREALLVTAAGPAAGLLLGGAAWAVGRLAGPLDGLAAVAVRDLVYVNVGWSIFNLFPLLPLDGARILDHATRLANGTREPRWVGWASLIAGCAVGILALSRHSTWIGFIALIGASQGAARLRATGGFWRRRPAGTTAAREDARRAMRRGELGRAAALLLPEARAGRLDEGDLADLVAVLVRLKRRRALVELCRERLGAFARREDAAPLARVAAEALADDGAHEEALAVSKAAFQQLGVPHHAYDAAAQLVPLGRHEEAVAWLRRAIDAGLDCAGTMWTDPALEPLRGRADFAALCRSATA